MTIFYFLVCKMDQEKNITIIDFEIGLQILEWQINNLIYEMFFEETDKNPNVQVINWIIKRIFKSLSTLVVLKDDKMYLNAEQLKQALDQKYMEYLYKFGRKLPKAVVKLKKLNF